jgi:hypothetical protein
VHYHWPQATARNPPTPRRLTGRPGAMARFSSRLMSLRIIGVAAVCAWLWCGADRSKGGRSLPAQGLRRRRSTCTAQVHGSVITPLCWITGGTLTTPVLQPKTPAPLQHPAPRRPSMENHVYTGHFATGNVIRCGGRLLNQLPEMPDRVVAWTYVRRVCTFSAPHHRSMDVPWRPLPMQTRTCW